MLRTGPGRSVLCTPPCHDHDSFTWSLPQGRARRRWSPRPWPRSRLRWGGSRWSSGIAVPAGSSATSLMPSPRRSQLSGPCSGRRESEDPRELAGLVGTIVGDRELVLVLDDAHLLEEWTSSAEVLAKLVRSRGRGIKLVLVERFAPTIPGIGAEVLAASATIGDDVIRADITEAEAIMAARGFDVDPFLALESSGGWIAGLVLEPGRRNPATSGRLAAFLAAEVRPRLHPEEDAFLVRCSVFDRIDRQRATALAGDAGPAMVDSLRTAGIPGVWDERERELRLHPRIREILGEELETASEAERVAAWTSAARAYELEGEVELALDALIRGRRSRRGPEAAAARDHRGGGAARRRGAGAAALRGAGGARAAGGDVRAALSRSRRAGGCGSAAGARGARTRRERCRRLRKAPRGWRHRGAHVLGNRARDRGVRRTRADPAGACVRHGTADPRPRARRSRRSRPRVRR